MSEYHPEVDSDCDYENSFADPNVAMQYWNMDQLYESLSDIEFYSNEHNYTSKWKMIFLKSENGVDQMMSMTINRMYRQMASVSTNFVYMPAAIGHA